MLKKISKLIVAAVLGMAASASHAEYPDRLIKILVPFAPGTSTDALARKIADTLRGIAGQPIIVENKAGAEGLLGVNALKSAEPDGYTMLFTSSSIYILDPIVRKKPRFDAVNDLKPICSLGRIGLGLYITSTLPFKNVAEFVAAAKAEPNKYTFGYASTTGRLGALLFLNQNGLQLRAIPYKATIAAITGAATGEVDMVVNDVFGADALIRAGKLRPLVVASSERLPELLSAPSAKEAGVPGFEMFATYAIFMPSKTPEPVLAKMREMVKQLSSTTEFKAAQAFAGSQEFTVCGDAMTKYQIAEMNKWRKLISDAKIELDD